MSNSVSYTIMNLQITENVITIQLEFLQLSQQNSLCSHCAVTGQWRCGDYPLTY